MSVEYIKRLAGPYVGDGTGQKTFSFGFLIFEESDVYVAVATSSDSEPSDLQQGTDYTVSMNADQSATPGGTITLTSETGLAKDAVLVIGSAVDYTQTLDLTNYTRFPPERITTELDRIVVMIQQIVELLGRVVQVPPTSSISPSDLFFQLLNAAESAAQSAEDAAASLAACEQIRQLIEQYSWDIPHIVDNLQQVADYPYDGYFWVGGFGKVPPGQDISNRYVKANGSTTQRTLGESFADITHLNGIALVKKKGSTLYVVSDPEGVADESPIIAEGTTTPRMLKDRFADVVCVKDFGAVGDGIHDDTEAVQAAMNAASNSGGKIVFIPAGTYMVSSLTLRDGVYLEGSGFDVTKLKQKVGTNATLLKTEGFDNKKPVEKFGLRKFEIDGSYLINRWNSQNNSYGNTSGNGLEICGRAFDIDIGISNISGIGAVFEMPDNSSVESVSDDTTSDYIADISVYGSVFGKEGLIIKGPGDHILRKAFIGLAGLVKLPEASTITATSSYYQGERVDGIVIDNCNVEIGDVHVYACWSGTGFRTRNTVRLTKGGRVISESNNSQVSLSAGTYGSAFFDIRNLSLLHPNWTGQIPDYTYPNPDWDGISIYSTSLSAEITCRRTITSVKRIKGSCAVSVYGTASIKLSFQNSQAPEGDDESGGYYTGNALYVAPTASGCTIDATVQNANGVAVDLQGYGNRVCFSAVRCTTAFARTSASNSKRGNCVEGSILQCGTGFISSGTPMSETICLSMDLNTGQTAFSGDLPDTGRSQIWDITASINNSGIATRRFLIGSLNDATTDQQTLSLPHKFLYTPRAEEVQWSLEDRATVATNLEYFYLSSIDNNNVNFVYKYKEAANPAANHRVSIRIG